MKLEEIFEYDWNEYAPDIQEEEHDNQLTVRDFLKQQKKAIMRAAVETETKPAPLTIPVSKLLKYSSNT